MFVGYRGYRRSGSGNSRWGVRVRSSGQRLKLRQMGSKIGWILAWNDECPPLECCDRLKQKRQQGDPKQQFCLRRMRKREEEYHKSTTKFDMIFTAILFLKKLTSYRAPTEDVFIPKGE